MGRHADWRKIAKKERRKRIRTIKAKERDKILSNEWFIKQQELEENLLLEQISKQNDEENEKWIEAEKIAIAHWKNLQEEKQRLKNKRLEQEAKLKLEWELEQKRKQKEEEMIKAAQEELNRKQEIFMKNLDLFLSGDSVEPPAELKVIHETKPDAELCPFFAKTSCCRFDDQCSRNHQYPGISKVLLGKNFYNHFGLNNANLTEYDTDIMLEFEDSDTYKEYTDFFFDVLSEFEKFGRLTQFKVCNNYEKHLRGNTYVEFAELRCAVAAYRSLHTRWYGGRQLSLQFCLITSWKNAICGLQLRRRCPKGRGCNFLHVFRNPNNLYNGYYNNEIEQEKERALRSSTRSWRWSESPEIDVSKRVISRRFESSDRRRRRSRNSEEKNDKNYRCTSPRRSDRHSSPQRSDRHSSPQRSDRHTSPRRSDRHTSPRRSDRRTSPLRSDRHTSPRRSDRHTSPWRSDRHTSPLRSDRHTSPWRNDRRTSPLRSDRHMSPPRSDRDASPRQSDRHSSPQRNDRHTSPLRSDRHTSPRRSDRHTSPRRSDRHTSPWRSDRHASPLRNYRHTSPLRGDRRTSPLRSDRRTSPLRSYRNTSPLRSDRRTSPLRSDRRTSPLRSNGRTSPLRSYRHTSPQRSDRRTSPLRSYRHRSPLRSDRRTSPLRSDGRTSPLRSYLHTSPLQSDRRTSPLRNYRHTSPLRSDRRTSSSAK